MVAPTKSFFLACLASLLAVTATLFTHYDSLSLLAPLAGCTGLVYGAMSFFLARYQPTRYVGKLLLSRIHYLVYNWTNHFVRSYWELTSWCVTISALYRATNTLWLSVLLGSVAGVILVLLSDLFSEVPFYETFEGSKADGQSVAAAVKVKALTSAAPSSTFTWNTVLLVYLLSQFQHGLLLVSRKYSNVLIVLLLIALGSLMMMVTADAMVSWKVSESAGRVLHQRITQASANWRMHPVRSSLETLSWLGAMLGYYAFGGHAEDSEGTRVLASAQAGLLTGVTVLLLNQDIHRWFTESSPAEEESLASKSKQQAAEGETAAEPQPPCLATPLQLPYQEYMGQEHPLLAELRHLKQTKYAGLPRYTMKQVAEHDNLSDLWIVVQGLVLDLTEWAPQHPAGVITLERFAGGDATDELLQFHPAWVLQKRLHSFVVGTVTDEPVVTALQADFRALHNALNDRGYFLPRAGYYVRKLMVLAVMFFSSIACVLLGDSFFWRMLGAILMAMFWQQIAFVGHDAGHMAVSYDRIWDYHLGYFIANLTTGIGVGWWKATHNVHHAVPNSLYDDPDIAHLPVFAVSPRFMESVWNTYHRRIMPFDWLARKVFVPYQHLLYYPIMAFARFNLYLQVLIWLAKSPAKYNPFRRTELMCLALFWGWYVALVCQIPETWQRWAFVLISHWVSGLLEVQITLSHFSMPVVEGDPDNMGKNRGPESYGGDFYTRNIAASLDVDCPPGLDWFHGGLQFQCIHHCFPRLNRANLRHIKAVFQELCDKHGLVYRQLPFVEANMDIIRCLKHTAEKTKTWSPLIKESFNAHG